MQEILGMQRRRPTPRKGSRRGSTRVWVLTVMRSFLSRRPPRRTTMTIQTRWRMMKHLPRATEEEAWEEDNERHF